MDFTQVKYDIIIKEWEHTNAAIGRLDNLVFIIRGWGVTFTTAALAYAYSKGDKWVALYTILPIILIWINDSLYKYFQDIYIRRGKEIEEYLSSLDFDRDFKTRTMSFPAPAVAGYFSRPKKADGSSGSKKAAEPSEARKGASYNIANAFIYDMKGVLKNGRKNNVLITYIPLILLALITFVLINGRPKVVSPEEERICVGIEIAAPTSASE